MLTGAVCPRAPVSPTNHSEIRLVGTNNSESVGETIRRRYGPYFGIDQLDLLATRRRRGWEPANFDLHFCEPSHDRVEALQSRECSLPRGRNSGRSLGGRMGAGDPSGIRVSRSFSPNLPQSWPSSSASLGHGVPSPCSQQCRARQRSAYSTDRRLPAS